MISLAGIGGEKRGPRSINTSLTDRSSWRAFWRVKTQSSFSHAASLLDSPLQETLGGKFCFIERSSVKTPDIPQRNLSLDSDHELFFLFSPALNTKSDMLWPFARALAAGIWDSLAVFFFLFFPFPVWVHSCYKAAEIPSLSIKTRDKSGHL